MRCGKGVVVVYVLVQILKELARLSTDDHLMQAALALQVMSLLAEV